ESSGLIVADSASLCLRITVGPTSLGEKTANLGQSWLQSAVVESVVSGQLPLRCYAPPDRVRHGKCEQRFGRDRLLGRPAPGPQVQGRAAEDRSRGGSPIQPGGLGRTFPSGRSDYFWAHRYRSIRRTAGMDPQRAEPGGRRRPALRPRDL